MFTISLGLLVLGIVLEVFGIIAVKGQIPPDGVVGVAAGMLAFLALPILDDWPRYNKVERGIALIFTIFATFMLVSALTGFGINVSKWLVVIMAGIIVVHIVYMAVISETET